MGQGFQRTPKVSFYSGSVFLSALYSWRKNFLADYQRLFHDAFIFDFFAVVYVHLASVHNDKTLWVWTDFLQQLFQEGRNEFMGSMCEVTRI